MRKAMKILASTLSLSLLVNASALTVFAGETTASPTSRTYMGEAMDDLKITSDERFIEFNQTLESEGYILEKITVESYPSPTATFAVSSGKTDEIVIMDYRQPAKSKKTYHNNWFNFANDIGNYVNTFIGLFDYWWVPASLLGLNADMIGSTFDDDWTELSTNDTLHVKVAYIYDANDNKQYWGADSSCYHYSGTVTSVVYNDNKDATRKSTDYNGDLYAVNYRNNSTLLRLGRQHYKDLAPYTEDWSDNNSTDIYL